MGQPPGNTRATSPRWPVVAAIALSCLWFDAASAAEGDADPGLAFFRERVEPLLRERCYDCHSHDAGEASGGLMLDSRAGWEVGGDSGPAVTPGDPDKSRLIRAVLHLDPGVEMPPDAKLTDAEIATLVEWVKLGAPDPRAGTVKTRQQIDLEAGRQFWAYRPVTDAMPPQVADAAWPADDIDRFILAKLESQGLQPAPDTDRATLARRLYFDLTGLPPTPPQIDAFVGDARPDAYERLVDDLLASRAFAERWGRHWLDVARFAESVTLRGLLYKEAWRYRDYVIDVFHRDVPLDRFIREQIAGDLLPAATTEDRTRQLVATTYLQLGNTNLEEQDKVQLRMDVVDEQLDVISKGLLATTVTCARCHDHKFDPIPTRDYYALAGILRNVRALKDANVSNWVEVPLPAPPEVEAAVQAHETAVAALEARVKAAKAKSPGSASAGGGPLPLAETPGIVVDDAAAQKVGEWKHSVFSGNYVGAGYVHDLDTGKGEKTITFQPELPASGEYEVWLAYSPGDSRSNRAPVSVFGLDGEAPIAVDMRPAPPIAGRFLSLGRFRFEKDGQCFVLISTADTSGHVTADAVAFIPAADVAAAEKRFAAPARASSGENVAALEAELKKLKAAAPKRPMTMSVVEEPEIKDIPVHVRGSVHNLGEVVPRGFLSVASSGSVSLPTDQSGRVQLADWLASRDNPLTPRVFVNRAWHWLFGAGIVRTVDNFGVTGESPSHPELLDHLAARFIEDGWSVKRLVRRIVLSRTYRQVAVADAAAVAADPENRLVARANVRRLDAECLRDGMLLVSGSLTDFGGGPTFPPTLAADYGFRTDTTYRSVYLPVFRNALPELFEVFDFADSSTVTGRRNTGTVPQQALFLTNNPFAIEQASLAARRLVGEGTGDDARLVRAYRSTLGREPSDAERQAIESFLATRPDDAEAAWALVFQALFASPEFRYLD